MTEVSTEFAQVVGKCGALVTLAVPETAVQLPTLVKVDSDPLLQLLSVYLFLGS